MSADGFVLVSTEQRLQSLERDRGGIAADISSLRTEMRVEIKNMKETLARIEDKLDGDRPTPIEVIQAMRSQKPNFEIDGKRLQLKVKGLLPILVSIVAITLAVLAWFVRR